MAVVNGSIWIEGDDFKFISSTGVEKTITGANLGLRSGATPGSIWMPGIEVHYIDSSGKEREILANDGASGSTATRGSVWIEGQSFHWICFNSGLGQLQERVYTP